MAIKEVTMYTVKCDGCGMTSGEDSDYVAYTTKEYAIEDAYDQDWENIENKYYCPSCYERDDNDNIKIKTKTTKL